MRNGSHIMRKPMRRGTTELRRSPFRSKPPRDEVEWTPRTALPKKNTKRQKARKVAGLVKGDYHFWIMTLPCTLAGVNGHVCMGMIEGHHVQTIGAGGKDRGNEIPLCGGLHTLSDESVHMLGQQSFDAYWGIDSKQIATALELDYDDQQFTEAA